MENPTFLRRVYSAAPLPELGGGGGGGGGGEEEALSPAEARRLVRLMNVEELKRHIRERGGGGDGEVIGYAELLDVCEGAGVARTHAEAAATARVLDEAGVVLLFRDKVHLHPKKGWF